MGTQLTKITAALCSNTCTSTSLFFLLLCLLFLKHPSLDLTHHQLDSQAALLLLLLLPSSLLLLLLLNVFNLQRTLLPPFVSFFFSPDFFPFCNCTSLIELESPIFLNTHAACTHILNTENGHTHSHTHTHKEHTQSTHSANPLNQTTLFLKTADLSPRSP